MNNCLGNRRLNKLRSQSIKGAQDVHHHRFIEISMRVVMNFSTATYADRHNKGEKKWLGQVRMKKRGRTE